MTPELKSCDFCGSENISVDAGGFCFCENCGACGPQAHPALNELAIDLWNTRTVPEPTPAMLNFGGDELVKHITISGNWDDVINIVRSIYKAMQEASDVD